MYELLMLRAPTYVFGPFAARSLFVTDAAARDHVLSVVKLALSIPIGPSPDAALVAAEVRTLPERYEERASSEIRFPSDLAPEKPGTEVLLVGHARHPVAYPDARWVDVTLSVEASSTRLRKSLRVFGPRRWIGEGAARTPSEPERYVETPLRWTWAAGGPADGACHRIEYADGRAVARAGFGAIPAHWEPRRSRAGSPPDDIAPHPPADRHPRFYCSAPDDQWLETPLTGGETFVVTGVHAERAWTFVLPSIRPVVSWSVRGQVSRAEPHVDTVLLDADEGRVEIAFRTRFVAPRDASHVDWIRVAPAYTLPAWAGAEDPPGLHVA
jgi:hypothetical protein